MFRGLIIRLAIIMEKKIENIFIWFTIFQLRNQDLRQKTGKKVLTKMISGNKKLLLSLTEEKKYF